MFWINQSSTDQSVVDTDIPFRLAGLAFAIIQLLSIVALMCQVAWQVFFLFLIVFAISIWYQVTTFLIYCEQLYADLVNACVSTSNDFFNAGILHQQCQGISQNGSSSASSNSPSLFRIDSWSNSYTKLQSGSPFLEDKC